MAEGLISGPERMAVAFLRGSGTGYQPGETVPAAHGDTDVRPLGELTASPGPGAAVGSVNQRTRTRAMQSLQRTAAFTVPVAAPAGRPPSVSYPQGTNGDGSADSPMQDSVALTLAAPAAEPRGGGPAGQPHGSNGAVQRLSLPEAPEAAAPPEISAPASPVEAGSQAVPAGTAPPEDPAIPAPERSTAGAPGSLGAASPEQLEELAKRLAGPLIRRIKAEMLLDRERRGLRTDSN